jgi:agmatinase
MEMPFQGLATFLKSPVEYFDSPIGIWGIPFDGCTSFRPGARFAPNAIRKASMMLTDGQHPTLDVNPCEMVSDFGDIAVSNTNVRVALEKIHGVVSSGLTYRPHQKLLFMGGDHTISTATVRAFGEKYPDLFVLHLDAHCDTWMDHFGDPLGHGTWVRNVVDGGYVDAANILQVGIRSPVDPETRDYLSKRSGRVYNARNALNFGAWDILQEVPLDKPLYISVDIDCLDPAYAPGTGTPEIGGLTPHFLLDLLEGLKGHNIVGADLVEVNPMFDPTEITALAGATALWTIAAAMGVAIKASYL